MFKKITKIALLRTKQRVNKDCEWQQNACRAVRGEDPIPTMCHFPSVGVTWYQYFCLSPQAEEEGAQTCGSDDVLTGLCPPQHFQQYRNGAGAGAMERSAALSRLPPAPAPSLSVFACGTLVSPYLLWPSPTCLFLL